MNLFRGRNTGILYDPGDSIDINQSTISLNSERNTTRFFSFAVNYRNYSIEHPGGS